MLQELFGFSNKENITLRNVLFALIFTAAAIAVNFCGSLIAEKITFPLYLDSLLTIGVVSLFGLIPGILCAFLSNLFLSIWTSSNLLFSICHICTAFFAWCVFLIQEEIQKKSSGSISQKQEFSIDAFIWAGLLAGLTNGFIGNAISAVVFKGQPPMPQANIVVQGLYVAFANLNLANNIAGLLENLIDKLLSAMLSFVFYLSLKNRKIEK